MIFLLLVSLIPIPRSENLVVSSDLESKLMNIYSIFWDDEFDGFYHSIYSEETVRDSWRNLEDHVVAALTFRYFYKRTSNSTYLMIGEKILNFICQNLNTTTGTFHAKISQNLSKPLILSGGDEVQGTLSLIATLRMGILLTNFYDITHNETYLNWAKRLFDSIIYTFWDPDEGGLLSLSDIYVLARPSGPYGLFAYFLYNLYELTNNKTYLNYFKETIDQLNLMWDNGLHHAYRVNYEILNSFRYPAERLARGALGYFLAYRLFANETYLQRCEVLLNQTLFLIWDNKYGGMLGVWIPTLKFMRIQK